jgi:acetamidase/formamidase
MRAGTTACFGVHVPGGQLSLGDGDCRQGEGEVYGTVVESAMRTVMGSDAVVADGVHDRLRQTAAAYLAQR